MSVIAKLSRRRFLKYTTGGLLAAAGKPLIIQAKPSTPTISSPIQANNAFGLCIGNFPVSPWGGQPSPAPTIPYSVYRTHDGPFSKWWDVQPSGATSFNFTQLDIVINKHLTEGRDVLFTLYGTPNWASARPTEALSAYAAQPSDHVGGSTEPANMSDWANYCAAVARRYPGIKYFEVWNEPNCFMVPVTSGTNGNKTITVANGLGIAVGMQVSPFAPGIQSNCMVTAISGANITLSQPLTANITTRTQIQFSPYFTRPYKGTVNTNTITVVDTSSIISNSPCSLDGNKYTVKNIGVLVNAGSFVTGVKYSIATVGTTTNWASIGWSATSGHTSPTIGDSFTATGVGSGDGIAFTSTPVSVNAGLFVVGVKYTITTVGTTTDWSAIGYAVSGFDQPNWPTTVGSGVTDGNIKWTCIAMPAATPATWSPSTPFSNNSIVVPTVANGKAYKSSSTPAVGTTFTATGAGSGDGKASISPDTLVISPNLVQTPTSGTALFQYKSTGLFYTGWKETLTAMTRIASAAIKSVSPNAQIITPAVAQIQNNYYSDALVFPPTTFTSVNNSNIPTTKNCFSDIVHILTAPDSNQTYVGDSSVKGNQCMDYADIIGTHLYITTTGSEYLNIANINYLKTWLATTTSASKPLWCTEAGIVITTQPVAVLQPELRRLILVPILLGFSKFVYYGWDFKSFSLNTVDPTIISQIQSDFSSITGKTLAAPLSMPTVGGPITASFSDGSTLTF